MFCISLTWHQSPFPTWSLPPFQPHLCSSPPLQYYMFQQPQTSGYYPQKKHILFHRVQLFTHLYYSFCLPLWLFKIIHFSRINSNNNYSMKFYQFPQVLVFLLVSLRQFVQHTFVEFPVFYYKYLFTYPWCTKVRVVSVKMNCVSICTPNLWRLYLTQCLMQSICSVNRCWVDKWIVN